MSNYVRAQELEVAGYHEPPLGTLFGFPCKCLDQTATFFLSNPALESKSGPLIARTTVHRRPSIFYLRSSLFGPGSQSLSHLQFFYELEMNYRNKDFMCLELFPLLLFCSSIYNCCKNCNKAYFLLFKVISYYFISFEFFFFF